jgi:SH3-like domain-containing protein
MGPPSSRWAWRIVALCSALLFSGFPAERALAVDEAVTYRVVNVERGDVLNMRAGPSSAYSVVGSIPPAEVGIRSVGPCREWCQVEYKGVSGWVNRRFLAVEAAVAPFAQRTSEQRTEELSYWRVVGVASNDVLMVRTAPSQQAPVAHVYPPTAACLVGIGRCQGPWCQLRIPGRDGDQVGWVDARQVAPSNAACN